MTPKIFLISSVIVLVATVALNVFLTRQNNARLTQDDKEKLANDFLRHRSFATYIPRVITLALGIMVVALVTRIAEMRTILIAFQVGVALLIAVSITCRIAVLRRLSEISLPDSYVSAFKLQSMLAQFGVIVAMSLFAYGIVGLFG